MFLKTCYKKSLPIFSFFICFILILGFLNYKVIQIHPFQIWGMFSRPIYEKELLNCYVISVNDEIYPLYDTKNRLKIAHLNQTISKYLQLKQGEDPFKSSSLLINEKYNLNIEHIINDVFTDRKSIKNYQKWLLDYMQQFHKEEIMSYKVTKVSLKYNTDGKVEKVKEQLIFNFNKK